MSAPLQGIEIDSCFKRRLQRSAKEGWGCYKPSWLSRVHWWLVPARNLSTFSTLTRQCMVTLPVVKMMSSQAMIVRGGMFVFLFCRQLCCLSSRGIRLGMFIVLDLEIAAGEEFACTSLLCLALITQGNFAVVQRQNPNIYWLEVSKSCLGNFRRSKRSKVIDLRWSTKGQQSNILTFGVKWRTYI